MAAFIGEHHRAVLRLPWDLEREEEARSEAPESGEVHPRRRDEGFRQLSRKAVAGIQDASAGAMLIEEETKIPERWDDINDDVTRLP